MSQHVRGRMWTPGDWAEMETNNVSKSAHGGTPVESHVYRDRVCALVCAIRTLKLCCLIECVVSCCSAQDVSCMFCLVTTPVSCPLIIAHTHNILHQQHVVMVGMPLILQRVILVYSLKWTQMSQLIGMQTRTTALVLRNHLNVPPR